MSSISKMLVCSVVGAGLWLANSSTADAGCRHRHRRGGCCSSNYSYSAPVSSGCCGSDAYGSSGYYGGTGYAGQGYYGNQGYNSAVYSNQGNVGAGYNNQNTGVNAGVQAGPTMAPGVSPSVNAGAGAQTPAPPAAGR